MRSTSKSAFNAKHARALMLVPLLGATLSGCVAKTAFDVVTAPVKVVSKAADLATTSQSEADEARGREIRRREERLGRLERDYAKQAERCEDGRSSACEKAAEIRAEMSELVSTLPYEPERS
jgi:hypothetical protein